MIAHLRGTVSKLSPGDVSVEVHGVGYRVSVPLPAWEALEDEREALLWISTYVREDRLDLYGFLERTDRALFEELIARPGIGPRIGLELCAVPVLLEQAIAEEDPRLLMSVKGIGKKTAEKLLVDLRSLGERHPELLRRTRGKGESDRASDHDTIAALSSLGYDMPTILQALRKIPKDAASTEQRVTAALRSL
jgi:Holliday junction DNA helicase RuvA